MKILQNTIIRLLKTHPSIIIRLLKICLITLHLNHTEADIVQEDPALLHRRLPHRRRILVRSQTQHSSRLLLILLVLLSRRNIII